MEENPKDLLLEISIDFIFLANLNYYLLLAEFAKYRQAGWQTGVPAFIQTIKIITIEIKRKQKHKKKENEMQANLNENLLYRTWTSTCCENKNKTTIIPRVYIFKRFIFKCENIENSIETKRNL